MTGVVFSLANAATYLLNRLVLLYFRTFCDFKLVLDSGREVPVHKMVLSSTSTYFSCLFQSKMRETQLGFVELTGMRDDTVLVCICL